MKFQSTIVCLLLVFILGNSYALAKRHQSSNDQNSAQANGIPNLPKKDMDPVTSGFLWTLCHKPELMNIEYLQYFVGKPENQQTHMMSVSNVYYWYDPFQHLKAELHQEANTPGQIMQSVMIVYLPPVTGFTLAEVQKRLGQSAKKFFDNNGHPTVLYTYALYTSLSFSSAPNSFTVTKAIVTYNGPPLAQPNPFDIQAARAAFAAKTAINYSQKKIHPDAAYMLRERLNEDPNDVQAHANLAYVLMKTGHVYEAIDEYKTTLALNQTQGNEIVRRECIDGLKALHVLPASYDPNSYDEYQGFAAPLVRQLNVTQGGQHLRVMEQNKDNQQNQNQNQQGY